MLIILGLFKNPVAISSGSEYFELVEGRFSKVGGPDTVSVGCMLYRSIIPPELVDS